MAQEAAVAAVAVPAQAPPPLPVAEGEVVGASPALDGPPRAKEATLALGAAASAARATTIAVVALPRLGATERLLTFPRRREPFPSGVLVSVIPCSAPLSFPRPIGASTGLREVTCPALAGQRGRARSGVLPFRQGDTQVEPAPTRVAAPVLRPRCTGPTWAATAQGATFLALTRRTRTRPAPSS